MVPNYPLATLKTESWKTLRRASATITALGRHSAVRSEWHSGTRRRGAALLQSGNAKLQSASSPPEASGRVPV